VDAVAERDVADVAASDVEAVGVGELRGLKRLRVTF